jgi:Fucose dissimilation pathway protein FucU
MLRGIPSVLTPDLLAVLCEMGHGDEIVIGDMNYPAAATASNALIFAPSVDSVRLLDAILRLMPLDRYVDKPFLIMERQAVDARLFLPVHEDYFRLAEKYDPRGRECVGYISRFDFYDRARDAYAVIATGEPSLYGSTILRKGCLKPEEVL